MIAIAAISLAVSFFLLFSPLAAMSDLAGFIGLTLFAILVNGSMIIYPIPHLASGAEMADDYHQRSTLFAGDSLMGTIARAITSIVIYRVCFPTSEQYSPR